VTRLRFGSPWLIWTVSLLLWLLGLLSLLWLLGLLRALRLLGLLRALRLPALVPGPSLL